MDFGKSPILFVLWAQISWVTSFSDDYFAYRLQILQEGFEKFVQQNMVFYKVHRFVSQYYQVKLSYIVFQNFLVLSKSVFVFIVDRLSHQHCT